MKEMLLGLHTTIVDCDRGLGLDLDLGLDHLQG